MFSPPANCIPAVCNIGERVLPTVRARAKRGGDRAKGPLETRTPGPKNMMREVRREGGGAAHGKCGCSSLRVRWWGMLTMNSHGVEFAIAGCGREMVRDPNPMSSFFLFFFFYHAFIVFKVQEASCSASYGKNKTHKSKQNNKVNQLSFPPRRLKNLLALNHSAIVSLENIHIGKFNSADYFSSVRFLQGKSFIRGCGGHLVTQAFTQKTQRKLTSRN